MAHETDVTNNHPAIHVGQKFRLLQAMLLARNPGACEYVRDGRPVCVIGQLAVKEGADPADLEPWAAATVNHMLCESLEDEYAHPDGTVDGWEDPAGALDALESYPVSLLMRLQSEFDATKCQDDPFPPLPRMYEVLNDYPVRNVQPEDTVNGMRVSSTRDADSFTRFFSAGCAALEEMVQDRIAQGAA